MKVRCSLGLRVTQSSASKEDLSANILAMTTLTLPAAKPFETFSVNLTVQADLPQTKDGAFVEHRVRQIHKKSSKMICLLSGSNCRS